MNNLARPIDAEFEDNSNLREDHSNDHDGRIVVLTEPLEPKKREKVGKVKFPKRWHERRLLDEEELLNDYKEFLPSASRGGKNKKPS